MKAVEKRKEKGKERKGKEEREFVITTTTSLLLIRDQIKSNNVDANERNSPNASSGILI